MSEPQVDTVATPSITITDAYVNEEERVLDPAVLDKSLIERMPDPSGWRLLVLQNQIHHHHLKKYGNTLFVM